MKIAFTDDAEYVTECLKSPAVWRMGSDDFLKDVDPSRLNTMARGEDLWVRTPHGVLLGYKINLVNYECHLALEPSAAGIAVDVCKQAMAFVFQNTAIVRLNATIPAYNHLAIGLAKRCGFSFIGVNERSILKDGILHDQLFYGISKQ